MDISEKIRLLRNRNGFSQEELADKVGVSRQSISKWESGHAVPEINKLLKLSEIFGVTSDQLINPDLGIDDDKKNEHSANQGYTQYGSPMGELDKEWFLKGYIRGKKILIAFAVLIAFYILVMILSFVVTDSADVMLMLIPLLMNASIIGMIVGFVMMVINRSKLMRYWPGEEMRQRIKEESKKQITKQKTFKIGSIILTIIALVTGLSIILSYNLSSHNFESLELIEFSPTFFMNIITLGVLLFFVIIIVYVIISIIKPKR